MEHLELIKQFCNIGRSHRWDLLKNILDEDFYFESGLRRIEGARNYIDFERGRSLATTFDTMNLFRSNSGEEYYHIYELTTYDPVFYQAMYHEIIGVRGELIRYSIITANWAEFPQVILNRFKETS